jgi:hypothetical protein
LPSGWRLPNQDELFEQTPSKGGCSFMQVDADFNGDGLIDQARILINKKGPGIGLFAFMAKPDGSYRTKQLANAAGEMGGRVLGIKVVQPGEYLTACGKGYYDNPTGRLKRYLSNTRQLTFSCWKGLAHFFIGSQKNELSKEPGSATDTSDY